ncbi:MAG: hypothetical protein MJ237_09250 [bacterium]|nr:hypothetical protein [bacterium]
MKHIFIVVLVAFIPFKAFAQDYIQQPSSTTPIQRTFFGCELGEFTYSQAKHTLKKKGIKCYTVNIEGELTLVCENITFGGNIWDVAMMSFQNNKFLKIVFIAQETDSYNDLMFSLYSRFVNVISSKYPSLLMKTLQQNSFSDDAKVYWQDENTSIILEYLQENSHTRDCILGYADNKLSNEILQLNMNDL